ncbi:unnamed protein product [Brassicogethes aeneus]|uniref:DUF4817 domain-containing protein n=1 Tax=Brassicogethes aeneus TaxID=1431903 RepID=A0A9P0AZM3_BRAAE|nr:unnamed protein product [Brassicogethes aeneus]
MSCDEEIKCHSEKAATNNSRQQQFINLQTKRPPFVKQLFIVDFLTVEEKIEMVLIYEEAGRNLDDAVNIYAQRFPEKIDHQFTTNGSVQLIKRVRRATVAGGNNEINVLAATAANPRASSRELSRDLGISQSRTVKQVLPSPTAGLRAESLVTPNTLGKVPGSLVESTAGCFRLVVDDVAQDGLFGVRHVCDVGHIKDMSEPRLATQRGPLW